MNHDFGFADRLMSTATAWRLVEQELSLAPSLVIVPELQAAGAQIVAYDPEGMRSAQSLLPGVEFANSAYACLAGADAAVVITEWDEFRALDLDRVKAALTRPVLVDLRNIYPIGTMKALGFQYFCVGRGLGAEAVGMDLVDS